MKGLSPCMAVDGFLFHMLLYVIRTRGLIKLSTPERSHDDAENQTVTSEAIKNVSDSMLGTYADILPKGKTPVQLVREERASAYGKVKK